MSDKVGYEGRYKYRLVLVVACIVVICCAIRLLLGCSQGCPRSAGVLKRRCWWWKKGFPCLSDRLLSDCSFEGFLGDGKAVRAPSNGGRVIATLNAVRYGKVGVVHLIAHRDDEFPRE